MKHSMRIPHALMKRVQGDRLVQDVIAEAVERYAAGTPTETYVQVNHTYVVDAEVLRKAQARARAEGVSLSGAVKALLWSGQQDGAASPLEKE
jgi:hypothetical protein